MELTNLWILLALIVLLNLVFAGLFSFFLLVLVLTSSYAICKLYLSTNRSVTDNGLWAGLLSISGAISGKRQGLVELLENRRILRFLQTRERDEIFFCFVCQERRCLRHGLEVKVRLFPERRILLNSRLNGLLTENINLCLEEVNSLRENPKLCSEVRRCITFVIGNLVTRMRYNIDSSELICKRLSTSITQHLYLFLKGKRQARSAYFIREQVIKVYKENGFYCDSNDLHSMIKNCHHLLLSPTLLSNSTLALFSLEIIVNCVLEPFLDLISNPLYFNTFIILLLDGFSNLAKANSDVTNNLSNDHHHKLQSNHSIEVGDDGHETCDSMDQLLDNFSKPRLEAEEEENGFSLSLKVIMRDEQLLFVFMQHLKEEGSVNLLQFLLSVDAFNCRLLKPDLTEEEKVDLTRELELLWEEYFDEESPDYIHFHDSSITSSLREIITEHKEIILLQNSDPLYKAYDQVYNTIDRVYLPLFTESSLYFKLIAGSRSNHSLSFDANEGDNLSLSSQISSIPEINVKKFNGKSLEDAGSLDKDSIKEIDETKAKEDIQEIHDLSSWQVKMDRVDKRVKNGFEEETEMNEDEEDRLLYFIKVDDPKEEISWEIQRELDEFHVLQSKLKQFHGNIKGIDIQLPKKRINLFSSTSYFPVSQANISFLEGHLSDLQIFMETLLSNPALQFSSLLHSFLKPSPASNQFSSSSVDFRKMIRNLNSSFSLKGGTDLRTSLQPFIMSFLNSTESKRNNSSSTADKETSNPGLKSNSNSFEDALDPLEADHLFPTKNTSESTEGAADPARDGKGNSFYELILFIMSSIYDLDETSSTVYYFLQLLEPLAKDSLQSIATNLLENELSSSVTLDNCIDALETLKSALKTRKCPRDSGEEEKLRKSREKEAFRAIQTKLNYIPFTPSSLAFHLYYCFQFPSLNKQFLYMILNHLIHLLFPEIQS